MSDIPIAIIGGGVIGCAVAWELSSRHENVFLFEKNPGITQGENQSSRNSGVIHSGLYYDQETRPKKARLCIKGNQLLYDFCNKHNVPAKRTGKLIVAIDSAQDEILDIYLKRALLNNVPGVKKIPAPQVSKLEPNVRAVSALLVPSAGIVEPTELVYRLYTLASNNGVEFMTGTEIIGLQKNGDEILLDILYPDDQTEQVSSSLVINASGVDADLIARMINPESLYELDPVRGDAYKFYMDKRPSLGLSGMNVYPTPELVVTQDGSHFTVGVHLTPTFEDPSEASFPGSTVTVGPKLVPIKHRHDMAETPHIPSDLFAEKAGTFFPGLKSDDLIWHQSGIQARLKDHPDFEITRDPLNPGVINLLGIDSPGLTSCLSVAQFVGEMVKEFF
ncbi:MAG: FAD-dependent oxidoreductase [Deltaproteobacteria bacterium]|nr:FAD-dependent oxidoreductase [Deltaproteobacteria bacterium]MBW1915567.1 FAD-dependent oxidoreductase [Deltaproteobacteria bacterium]